MEAFVNGVKIVGKPEEIAEVLARLEKEKKPQKKSSSNGGYTFCGYDVYDADGNWEGSL